MRDYRSESLEKYIDDLAARLPAPGGGSAVALVGALGMALLSMVSNFTLGKENYKGSEREIEEILKRSEVLRGKLTRLIDEDIRVYSRVSKAYRLPRTTERGKELRAREIEQACKEALTVPLEVVHHCSEGLGLARRLVEIGNVRLVSDVGVAAALLEAALKGAEINVEINLGAIKDKDFVEEKRKVVGSLVKGSLEIREEILRKTEDRIRNID